MTGLAEILFGAMLFVPALILTVIIHETGHLLGGLISHYRFCHIRLLFVSVTYIERPGREVGDLKKQKRLRIGISRRGPIGQCIMIPRYDNDNPEIFVMGGCLANMLFAAVTAIMAAVMFYESMDAFFLLMISVTNFIIGIYNALWGSEAADGRTFREVRQHACNRRAYNSLMRIYECLLAGKSLAEVPDSVFFIRSVKSSLTSELLYYECKRELEFIKNGRKSKEIEKRVQERLKILSECRYRQIAVAAREVLKELEYKNECSRENIRSVYSVGSDADFSGRMGNAGS